MQPCATKVPSEMQPCAPDDSTNSFFRQFHSAKTTDNTTNSFSQNTTKIPRNHRTALTTVLCNTHTTRASISQNAKTAFPTVFCNTRPHTTRAKLRLLHTCWQSRWPKHSLKVLYASTDHTIILHITLNTILTTNDQSNTTKIHP